MYFFKISEKRVLLNVLKLLLKSINEVHTNYDLQNMCLYLFIVIF